MTRATDISPEAPTWELVVDGKRLPYGIKRQIETVTTHATLEGATQLSLIGDALDGTDMTLSLLDDRVLFPGSKVELWAGYGSSLFPKGRFKVLSQEPEYTADGVPFTIEAFDGLKRFLGDKEGRLIQGVTSHSDAVALMMERDYPDMGYLIEPGPEKKGDRFKKAGVTDLNLLKRFAIADGFAYPRVWTRDQYEFLRNEVKSGLGGNDLALFIALDGAAKVRDDMLIYVPLSTLYNFIKPVDLWWSPTRASDWTALRIFFSAADLPTAVEVYGTANVGGEKKLVRAVVEYGSEGVKIAEVEEDWEDDWAKQQKLRKELSSGGKLKLYTLSDGIRAYETGGTFSYRNDKGVQVKGKSKRAGREILNGNGVLIDSEQDVLEFAKRWFLARASAYLVGSGTLMNTPGLERLDVSQVHNIRGVATPHQGAFVFTEVTHTWTAEDHSVNVGLQKLVTEQDLSVNGAAPTATSEETE